MRPLLLLLALLFPLLVSAEVFRTQRGESFNGQIAGVYGDIVFLKTKAGTASIDLGNLDDASLALIADFLARPKSTAPWSASASRLNKALANRLQVLRGGELVPFDRGTRPEPEFYLVYFGAHWCGPCREFSPELLKNYKAMKTVAPDLFEVIFVSDDRDSYEQLTYVRDLPMPWPVVRYGANVRALDEWRGPGIPCLVVLTREGDLLMHSYSGEKYLGADDPLEKFRALLAHLLLNRPTPGRHRLAIASHLRAAAGGNRAPARYRVAIDPRRNRTLPKQPFTARVTIDLRGHATSAEFVPALDPVAESQLQRETEEWLFLPAIQNGKPVQSVLEIPIRLED